MKTMFTCKVEWLKGNLLDAEIGTIATYEFNDEGCKKLIADQKKGTVRIIAMCCKEVD